MSIWPKVMQLVCGRAAFPAQLSPAPLSHMELAWGKPGTSENVVEVWVQENVLEHFFFFFSMNIYIILPSDPNTFSLIFSVILERLMRCLSPKVWLLLIYSLSFSLPSYLLTVLAQRAGKKLLIRLSVCVCARVYMCSRDQFAAFPYFLVTNIDSHFSQEFSGETVPSSQNPCHELNL